MAPLSHMGLFAALARVAPRLAGAAEAASLLDETLRLYIVAGVEALLSGAWALLNLFRLARSGRDFLSDCDWFGSPCRVPVESLSRAEAGGR